MPGMKRGDDIKLGWQELIVNPNQRPDGYSTVREIAEKLGLSLRWTREHLAILRRAGKIDAKQLTLNGHLQWIYKD